MGQPIFLDYDREALDREYDNRGKVTDFAHYLARYTTESAVARREVPCRLDVRYGASPRGAQALVLGAKVRALAEGRYNVSIEDIKAMTAPALRHRVILNFEGEAEGVDTDTLIGQVVEEAEASAIKSREPFLR